MMNQRAATVQTVLNILADRGVVYEMNGPINVKSVLTPDDKAKILNEMCDMYGRGEYPITTDPKGAELRKYVSGLINNWISKAPEFNNGKKHEIKNPGSRTGTSDEELKSLKALLEKVRGTANETVVQEAIDKRLSEIKPATVKEINVSVLPEHLRHLVK